MQNYNNLKSNEAQLSSIMSVKLQQFNILVQLFVSYKETEISVFTVVSGNCRRWIRKQRKGHIFLKVETMLSFIHSYMKSNTLPQTHAAVFNMNHPLANLWIHLLNKLIKILSDALEKSNCILYKTAGIFNKLLIEGQGILMDGIKCLYFD